MRDRSAGPRGAARPPTLALLVALLAFGAALTGITARHRRPHRAPAANAGEAPDSCCDEGTLPPKSPKLGPATPIRAWRLAFGRGDDIWTARGDGSEQRLVIRNASLPCWSRDRRQIAFFRDGNVWVASSDGNNQRQLTFVWQKDETPEYAGGGMDLSWNPLENVITFSHSRRYPPSGCGRVSAFASTYKTLFEVAPNARIDFLPSADEYGSYERDHPSWSPSGKALAFTHDLDVYVTTFEPPDADERRPKEMTHRLVAADDSYESSNASDTYE